MDLALGTYDLNNQLQLDHSSDIQFDSRGDLVTMTGADMVRQYVGKIFLTYQGDNTIDPSYGTTLDSFIGGAINDETNYALMKQTMLDAIAYAIQQYNNSVDTTEQINSIDTLSVVIGTDKNNNSQITISIQLTTVAGAIVTVGTVIV